MSLPITTCTKTNHISIFERLPSTGSVASLLHTGQIVPQLRCACENVLIYDFTGIVNSGLIPLNLQPVGQAVFGDIENISGLKSGCGSLAASGGLFVFLAGENVLPGGAMLGTGYYDASFGNETLCRTVSLGYGLRSGIMDRLPFYCDTGSIDSSLVVKRIIKTEETKFLRVNGFELTFTGVIADACWTGALEGDLPNPVS